MRDTLPGTVNSLTVEPVVLRVRFTQRTWVQVDFVQEIITRDEEGAHLNVAVLGPVPSTAIIDVLHCMHGRRLGSSSESIRSFDDARVLAGIQHLREKLRMKRPDAWVLKNLGMFTQSLSVSFAGGEMPDLTFEDSLRRLRQVRVS